MLRIVDAKARPDRLHRPAKLQRLTRLAMTPKCAFDSFAKSCSVNHSHCANVFLRMLDDVATDTDRTIRCSEEVSKSDLFKNALPKTNQASHRVK